MNSLAQTLGWGQVLMNLVSPSKRITSTTATAFTGRYSPWSFPFLTYTSLDNTVCRSSGGLIEQ